MAKVYPREIVSKKNVGTTASVVQRNDLLLHTFVTDVPAIILLRRGKKTLTVGTKKIVVRPGGAVAIAAGTTCEVLNETDNGKFESTWIVCDESLVDSFSKDQTSLKVLKGVTAVKGVGSEFSRSFELAVESIKAPATLPEFVAQNRVRELLVWLATTGYLFERERGADLQRKLRMMLGSELARDWLAPEVAASFAMSEASFRRKLAERGSTFNEILIDVRMTAALTLLQVTDLAISEVAYRVGYESASRFSVRFKRRFGFSPNAVRGRP